MKKFILAMSFPALFLLVSCDKEKIVEEGELPAKATVFISTHYSTNTIRQVVLERDDLRTRYHVYLDNNTKLDFTRDGDIKEIEGTEKIPDSVLPVLVTEYVNDHYAGQYIRSWDPNETSQEVGLSGDVDLLFDSNGNFIRVSS